jgi:hypothetical protein
MRKLLLLLTLSFTINVNAQDEKNVTLVVSGQGKTKDEAQQKALRSAIEQAFGTFISSKTEILNDNLVKDEIVSVTNGNIQKFEPVSEVQLPDGSYASTLKATVSVSKLTSFSKNKGVEVEFKGDLFASNILIQELYEKNEFSSIENLVTILKNISEKSFNYSIAAAEPFSGSGKWNIPLTINVTANENFVNIPTLLEQNLNSLKLSSIEVDNYTKLKKVVYPLTLATPKAKGIYYLRNKKSIELIVDFVYSLNNVISNISIFNGLEKINLEKYNTGTKYSTECNCSISNLEIFDDNFRIILKNRNSGGSCSVCPASLFHNFCGSRHDSKIPNFNYKSVYKKNASIEERLAARKAGLGDVSMIFDYAEYNIDYNEYNDKYCRIFLNEIYKSFFPLKKIIFSQQNDGIVLSFASIKTNALLVQFKFNDFRSVDEIKKLSKYEIIINEQ